MQGVFPRARSARVNHLVCGLVLAVAAVLTPIVFAGTPRLLADINTHANPISSDPVLLGRFGNVYLLGAVTSPGPISALFQTDFTSAGTVPLKTFAGRGPLVGDRGFTFVPAVGRAYFVAEETSTGADVWVTDGTAAGTHIVADFPGGEVPRLIGLLGSDLIFARTDETLAIQLYRTDGTAAGTRALTQFPASHGLNGDAVSYNGKLYFVAGPSAGSCCNDLWVSDGTAAGTRVITDPVNLPAGSHPTSLRVLGNRLLFVARGTYGAEIHSLDMTTDGVTQLDLNPGAPGVMASTQIVSMDGFALFVGSGSGAEGFELWRTDGTLANTFRVVDLNPGTADAFQSSRPQMIKVGNRVIFYARDGGSLEYQLWSSDGTAANTVRLTSMPNGWGPSIQPVGVAGTRAYFSVPVGGVVLGALAHQIMVSDGTVAGTHVVQVGVIRDFDTRVVRVAGDDTAAYVKVLTVNPSTMSVAGGVFKYEPGANRTTLLASTSPFAETSRIATDGGRLLYSTYDDAMGTEPYVSDGTPAGTRLLGNLAPENMTDSSDPQTLVEFNGKLMFMANDGVHGIEPWQSDGTAAGTKLIGDINPGPGSSNIQLPFSWNGGLYFFAEDGVNDHVFMRFDGTVAQTLALVDPLLQFVAPVPPAPPPPSCIRPTYAVLGTRLYFAAGDLQAGYELWSTDGTPAGTTRVVDVNPGTASSGPCGLTVFNGRIYFAANGGADAGGNELWSTDGTAAGTVRVLDLMPGPTNSNPVVMAAYDGALYFIAGGPNGGSQTWRTDGTAAGTRPLVEVASGQPGFVASVLGAVKGRLLLAQPTGSPPANYALWWSDGTSAGTVKMQATQLAIPSGLLITPDLIYFRGTGPAGKEPWVTDGTEAGTRMLLDVNPSGDTASVAWVNFRGVVLLQADDPARGPRFWRTDGTTAGTVALGDAGAMPSLAAVAGQNVFYTAVDPLLGRELFVLPNDAPVAAPDSGASANGQSVVLNVVTNDTDPDGSLDATTVRIVAAPAHGTATVASGGSITYVPAAGYSGADSFTYSVADNQGHVSNAAVVSVTVTAAPGSGNGGAGGSGGGSGGGGGGALGVFELLLLAMGLGVLGLPGLRRRRPWPSNPSDFVPTTSPTPPSLLQRAP